MKKWLSIVGIGEDGLAGLNPIARSLLAQAHVVVGGARHLAMLPPDDPREKLPWTAPIATSIEAIIRRRGQSICVLASGDPMCYGIGVTLTRHVAPEEMTIVPAPSAFSLACARLGWPATEVEMVSLCGRDPALLARGALSRGACAGVERRVAHAGTRRRATDATRLWQQPPHRARTHGGRTRAAGDRHRGLLGHGGGGSIEYDRHYLHR